MKTKFQTLIVRLASGSGAALVLAACATQTPSQPHVPGFAAGLFHGLVAIVALAGSVIYKIRIYAYPNSGLWYDAGFILGFSLNMLLVILFLLPRIGGFLTRRD